eukprot:2986422-Heterocapsa_arctica.AAC.1
MYRHNIIVFDCIGRYDGGNKQSRRNGHCEGVAQRLDSTCSHMGPFRAFSEAASFHIKKVGFVGFVLTQFLTYVGWISSEQQK